MIKYYVNDLLHAGILWYKDLAVLHSTYDRFNPFYAL